MTAADAFSFGGGVQSTATLVLAARGEIDLRRFLFANVGDDTENPATLDYIANVSGPYALAHGLELVTIRRTFRDGRDLTLLGELLRPDTRSVPIPVRMANGAPGRRNCSKEWKVKVVARWQATAGATADNPARIGIGFSWDEVERMSARWTEAHQVKVYPLLDLRLDRRACERLIADAGLPPAPKSSCWFCPEQRPATWARKRQESPDVFWRSVALERHLNGVRDRLGKDDVYFTRYGLPLDVAIADQPSLFDDEPEGCDDGSCFR